MKEIGEHLRLLREQRNLSQEDLEARTGLLHIAQLESGEQTPNIETLESLAHALGVSLHCFFYDGNFPPALSNLPGRLTADDIAETSSR